MAESEELKSLLMKVKESEKVGLKLNIQKMKIMASGPITSWQIDGETIETVRLSFLGRKAMTNLDSILKNRDTTLPTKAHLVKAIGEGNGTPLQYSCLENPMDGGAW